MSLISPKHMSLPHSLLHEFFSGHRVFYLSNDKNEEKPNQVLFSTAC
jgi:hypothetical protein